jgi:hypothetical protein
VLLGPPGTSKGHLAQRARWPSFQLPARSGTRRLRAGASR